MAIKLKSARIEAGLATLAQAAEKTGIHENTLASYEAYRTSPSIVNALKIAEAYNCEVGDIKWSKEE